MIYKLEIMTIELFSMYGKQVSISYDYLFSVLWPLQFHIFCGSLQFMIDPQDFQDSEPDILANSASAVIERIKENSDQCAMALRSLCRRKKGLTVEVCLLPLMSHFHVHNLKLSFLCMECSYFNHMSKFSISL